ncbi:stem cell self-renewal protein Piwi, partial [Lophium mytilinum]
DQYFSNLALKFNIKGRGINHTLRNEFSLLMGGANRALDTIVLGADVSHPPGNGPDGSPSIAAVVGSVDEHFMTYLGSMRLQAGRTEIISDMKDMVEERLLAWKAKNKVLPKRILFYRDGVSEGQYLEVISKEINAVTKAYQAAAGTDAAKPIITFLIVGKRHHTRFYPNQLEGTVDSTSRNPPRESNGNPRPGLVVDQVVTQPGKHNFYLQAHAAIKGTARPAHYQVLQNDMGLAHAQLQSLTHSLCYALGRATKGISYAAPAYLAHLLCDRGRAYLREWN